MNELQKLKIKAIPPAVRADAAERDLKEAIIEYYDKDDLNFLEESCERSIKNFVKQFPSPMLTDIEIYYLYYGAYAFRRLGKNSKHIACLKILYSLQNSKPLLSDSAIELLDLGIAEYKSIAEKGGIDNLNSIIIEKNTFKSSGCFIATAVYGSPYANEVLILKEFRDNWLLNCRLGKIFVAFYYWFSPPIANQIAKSISLNAITKSTLILPLIKIAKYLKRKEN